MIQGVSKWIRIQKDTAGRLFWLLVAPASLPIHPVLIQWIAQNIEVRISLGSANFREVMAWDISVTR